MKKFFVILTLLMTLTANLHAEIYHGIDVDAVYENGIFKNKQEVKNLIDDFTRINIKNNLHKTTESNVLDGYYINPQYMPIIKAKCGKDTSWIKGKFGLIEELNFKANMCLTWETNKKLNKKQIELLAQLSKVWEDIIMSFTLGNEYRDTFAIAYDNKLEYSLQLAVRMHNLVTKKKWPECVYEVDKSLDYIQYYKEPCNEPTDILKNCQNSMNVKLCMQQEITSKIEDFDTIKSQWITSEKVKKNRRKHLELLFHLTENFISQIISDNVRQEKEIIRLYNFYWSSILVSYQMNLTNANLD